MEETSPINAAARPDLLVSVLKDVSRSFYRTLRVLPRPVRRQVSLAYLLARTSDTIADSGRTPPGERLTALEKFRKRISSASKEPLDLGAICGDETPVAEQTLLRRVEESISVLGTFEQADRGLIIRVLDTITTGQEQDLRRFSPPAAKPVAADAGRLQLGMQSLETPEELDNYTYMVAGCVGEFWTRICRSHLFPKEPLDEQSLVADGIRFGKGLQLVNILRDLPSDLRQGRCYMPSTQLEKLGLRPQDLLDPANYTRFRPLHEEWMALAEEHLRIGWRYTNRLPWRQARVRLACAWPLLIGFETLRVVRQGNVLDASVRLKASRNWVKKMFIRSVLSYPIPPLWRRLVPE